MRSSSVLVFLGVVVVGLAGLAVALWLLSDEVPEGNRPVNPSPFEHVMDATEHWHFFDSVGRGRKGIFRRYSVSKLRSS